MKRNLKLKYYPPLILVFLLLIFSSIWSCAIFENPSVLNGSPGEFENVPNVRPSIWIEFSKPMNKQKTEKAFSITSDFKLPKGTFRWEGDTKFFYDLISDMEFGGYYSLKLAASAQDTDGNPLLSDYLVNFFIGTSRIFPAVSSILPANMNFNTNPADPVIVTFSKPMQKKDTEQAFSISPAVSGVFSWDTSSTVMTFTPLIQWKFTELYKVTIKTTARDTLGGTLNQEFISFFRAGLNFIKPNVTLVQTTGGQVLTDGQTNIEKTEGIAIFFDKAMNYSSVQSAFSLYDTVTGSLISGTYTWNAAFDQFTFKPNSNLTPEGHYKIVLTTSALDTFGNPLTADTIMNIQILGPNSLYLTVTSINLNPAISNCTFTTAITTIPIGGNILDFTTPGLINQISFNQLSPWSCPIEITFSKPMDALSVPTNIIFQRVTGNGANSGLISCGVNSCYNWNLTKTMITILLNDLGNDFGEFIYKLSITGGKSGVLDQQNNYLKDTVQVFINPIQ